MTYKTNLLNRTVSAEATVGAKSHQLLSSCRAKRKMLIVSKQEGWKGEQQRTPIGLYTLDSWVPLGSISTQSHSSFNIQNIFESAKCCSFPTVTRPTNIVVSNRRRRQISRAGLTNMEMLGADGVRLKTTVESILCS